MAAEPARANPDKVVNTNQTPKPVINEEAKKTQSDDDDSSSGFSTDSKDQDHDGPRSLKKKMSSENKSKEDLEKKR